MNRNISTEGIVLRKIDFNEADRIVSVLTPELGKIDCVAKGARRLKSPFCGRLELLCRIHLTGSQGRDLVTLNETQLIDSFPQENDLPRHRACFMIAEISHKLIQTHQQIEGAYPLLREALEALQQTPKTDSVLYAYLIRLMTLAGFLPKWNQCALCGAEFDAHQPIFVHLGDAHALCGDCRHPADRPLKPGIAQWINTLQNHPMALSLRVKAVAEQHDDLWLWLKEVMQTVLPHPLRSDELLVRVR
jgi:DNA repair protein RecO (recombination protein O)